MVIQTFSPLQADGSYYLNNEDFDSRLMFTDTSTTLNYIVCRLEGAVWHVIANGKLNGYNNGTTNYQYKFDFGNYIKITHNKEPQMTKDSTGVYYFNTGGDCSISLVCSISNVLTLNTGKLTTKSNGEIVLSGTNTPSTLTSNVPSFDYVFVDGVDGNPKFTTSPHLYANSYLPVIISKNYACSITIKDKDNGYIYSISPASDYNYLTYLCYLPTYAVSVTVSYDNGTYKTFNIEPKSCKNQIFYYGINGGLDMLYVEGNTHEVNNITKDYITVNNQKLPINIKCQKQLKCNTGYRLDQSQMYSLIKTPYVFNKVSVDVINDLSKNILRNVCKESWDSDSNSDRTYSTIDGYHTINVGTTIAGGNAWIGHGLIFEPGVTYTMSFNTVGTTQYQIGIVGNYPIFDGTTSRVSFQFQYINNAYNVIYITIPNANCNTTIYNIKIEKGSVATPYSYAWQDNMLVPTAPTLNRYQLDTTTFEGYVGSKYSEKNVELLLTDEKVRKRKTNFDLDFWD